MGNDKFHACQSAVGGCNLTNKLRVGNSEQFKVMSKSEDVVVISGFAPTYYC